MTFDVNFGGETSNGKEFVWGWEDRRRHAHVVGASDTGKSYFLQHLLRQDLLNPANPGVVLIDPHGALYNDLVEWIASVGLEKSRTIHLWNASAGDHVFGFNPCRAEDGVDPTTRVDAMVDALCQVWQGADPSQTPRLAKCLRAVFIALIENNLTLAEATALIDSGDAHGVRQYLTQELSNPVAQSLWDGFNGRARRQFEEMFESTESRFVELLLYQSLKYMLAQTDTSIDIRECMRMGDVVLVNLCQSEHLSASNARAIGAMLTSEIHLSAYSRDIEYGKEHPFYVYIDECHRYLNSDVETMLDATRKFGVHLVLAHQRLGQLQDQGEGIYNAVMTNARSKVVFGGLALEDATTMAEHLFLGQLDLEEGVELTKRAAVTGEYEETTLASGSSATAQMVGGAESVARSVSRSSGQSHLTSSSEGMSSGLSQGMSPDDPDGDPLSMTFSDASQFSNSEAWGTSESESESETHASTQSWANTTGETKGWHTSLKQVYAMQYSERYSKDEQIYKKAALLHSLPQQFCCVRTPDNYSVWLRVADVYKPMITKEFVAELEYALIEASKHTMKRSDIENMIEQRLERLVAESNPDVAEVDRDNPY